MVLAALVAIALFVVTWTLLHVGFYTRDQVQDTPIYQRYGNAIARGDVPYRDFSVEYPPGALPAFALPGLAKPGKDQHVTRGFRNVFESLMWLCGVSALIAMALSLRALRTGQWGVWGALAFAALAPLALGSVILSRFDLWPAALVAIVVALVVSGSWRAGSAVLGLAIAVKLYPAVLVPIVVASVLRRQGRRAGLVSLALTVAVAAAFFLPFFVLSPGGVWASLSGQLTRPLQLESAGAALLVALHHVAGLGVTVETSHGSQNLAGTGADAVGLASTVLQAGALVWVWIAFARGRLTFVQAVAAALAAFVALGKVLSPQFLIWLVAVIPLVRGRRGLSATALLGVALVLTQLYFPFRYWDLAKDLDPTASWLLLARDLVLVSVGALLVFPGRLVRSHVPVPGTVTGM